MMGDAFIELPNGDQYPAEAAGVIAEWVDFTCALVLIYRSQVEQMSEAIRLLGERAQSQYPQLESGGVVQLHLSQTEGWLDGLAFDFADRFVGITGSAILMSQDGPKVGADLLADQVPFLCKLVWGEGGENADDGDT